MGGVGWLPAAVRWLWNRLDRLDVTWLVGGAVRDGLLSIPPGDFDLATALSPERVWAWSRRLGLRTGLAGVRFGRVAIHVDGMVVDVTTFRTESAYQDRRHPSRVRWLRNGLGDLARRDFTVNAMALTRAGRLIDPFGGRRDLVSRILRPTGPARVMLADDAVRVWRAARFLAYAPGDWQWSADLAEALPGAAAEARGVAAERVGTEIQAALAKPYPARFLEASGSLGLLPAWTGDAPDLHDLTAGERLAIVRWRWNLPDWGTAYGLPRAWTVVADAIAQPLARRVVAEPDRLRPLVARVAERLGLALAVLPWTAGTLARLLGMSPGPRVGRVWIATGHWVLEHPGADAAAILAAARRLAAEEMS
jgi:hypothetical protein